MAKASRCLESRAHIIRPTKYSRQVALLRDHRVRPGGEVPYIQTSLIVYGTSGTLGALNSLSSNVCGVLQAGDKILADLKASRVPKWVLRPLSGTEETVRRKLRSLIYRVEMIRSSKINRHQ